MNEKRLSVNNAYQADILYKTIFNQSPDGILIIDTDGAFIEFNEAAHRQLGYSREEFKEMRISDIDPVQHPDEIQANINALLATGSAEFEVKHRTKGGEVRDVHVISQLITISGQTFFHTIWRDITDRKRIEEELRKTAKDLNEAQRIGRIGRWERDLATNRVEWSDETYRIFEIDPTEFDGSFEQVLNVVHPDDREFHDAAYRASLATRAPYSIDYRLLLPDGRFKYVHSQCETFFEDGRPVRSTGIVQDITERKQAERKLRASEYKFHSLFDAATDAIFILDLDGNFIDINRAGYERLGYTKEEMMRKHVSHIHHPAYAPLVAERIEQVKKNGHAVLESVHLKKDGAPMPVEINSRVIDFGDRKVLYSIIRDITERKRSEAALIETNAKLQTLIRALPDAVFFKDTSCRYLMVNRVFEEMMGADEAAFIGKSDEDIMSPELAAGCRRSDQALMREGKPVSVEDTIADREGNKVFLDSVKAPIYDAQGVLLGIVGVSRNVTARKLAEEALKQSEQFTRNILNSVDEGFIVVDRNYRIQTVNKAYADLAGESGEAVVGRHCYEVSHRTTRPCFEEGEDCAARRVFQTGRPQSSLHKHRDQNGAIVYVETKCFPIKDSSGTVTSVIETINNITEKHLLEEERLKTQKLESIGTLAGGIAHDFNNLLQGVFGYISMAKAVLDQKEKARAMLEQAEKALHQSVNLTTQLLTFSKGGKPVKKILQLLPIINNGVKFALSGSRSTYQLHIAPDLWLVEADEGQLAQVLQNIVLNADQAMPLGGSVLISARNLPSSDPLLPQELSQRDCVVISIRDSGIGISEQYLGKIFDPYFTTKEKGSGLGLATSYSIIRNHGGLIQVQSTAGKGSTFSLYLPACRKSVTSVTSAGIPTVRRKGRVLVMDDEEVIRQVSEQMLRELGHEVELVDRGEAAIDAYRSARDANRPFDVVILDLTIRGGMSGAETVQGLLNIDPQVKAIVSSGYSDNATIANYREKGFRTFLKKPYSIDELHVALNALLTS